MRHAFLLLALLLAACGQKGPLFLPPAVTAPAATEAAPTPADAADPDTRERGLPASQP